MNIYLIRHGLTIPGEEGRYQGSLDESLSDKGRDQLTQAPQKPSHVYVSPAKRARETASILFPQAEQICVPGLWEMNFGVFEGRTWKEMENDVRYREWVDGMCMGTCPGGESRASFSDRVCKAFLSVLDMEKTRQRKAAAGSPSVSAAAEGLFQESLSEKKLSEENLYGKDLLGKDLLGEGILEEDLFIVSHGGTQMAILERWGRPARDYYSWLRPCGCGWMLSLKEREDRSSDRNGLKVGEPDAENKKDCEMNTNSDGMNTKDYGMNTDRSSGMNTDNFGKDANDCEMNTDRSGAIELVVLEEVTLVRPVES